MRFCMVTTFYPPYHFGGDALFVQALGRALVARGHHVEVVHCEDAFRLQGREQSAGGGEQDGVLVHRIRSPFGMLLPDHPTDRQAGSKDFTAPSCARPGFRCRSISTTSLSSGDPVCFR